MKLCALYKVWSGKEWLEASLLSVIDHVSCVVILYSDVSWLGVEGNPAEQIIKQLEVQYPDKVIALKHNESDQLKHVEYGYQYIKENIDCDYVFFVDSDELWDEKNILRAKEYISENPGYKAYKTHIYTYIKSVYLRVEPPEPTQPVCFVSSNLDNLGKYSRGYGIKPEFLMDEVYYHHFSFVRKSFNDVLEKMIQSHISEKQPYHQMNVWIPEVWNKLPSYNREIFYKGFQPAIGFEGNWKGLKKVESTDLPEVLSLGKFKTIRTYGS